MWVSIKAPEPLNIEQLNLPQCIAGPSILVLTQSHMGRGHWCQVILRGVRNLFLVSSSLSSCNRRNDCRASARTCSSAKQQRRYGINTRHSWRSERCCPFWNDCHVSRFDNSDWMGHLQWPEWDARLTGSIYRGRRRVLQSWRNGRIGYSDAHHIPDAFAQSFWCDVINFI